jgi:hypothetical protein
MHSRGVLADLGPVTLLRGSTWRGQQLRSADQTAVG